MVKVIFPDNIPKDFLIKGDNDREIAGYVYPNDPTRERAGIYVDGELVGFMTPRQVKDGRWRVGALYINPKKRGKGVAADAIKEFFKDKKASPVPIGVDNISSQKTFSKAGFQLDPNNNEPITWKDGWLSQRWIK